MVMLGKYGIKLSSASEVVGFCDFDRGTFLTRGSRRQKLTEIEKILGFFGLSQSAVVGGYIVLCWHLIPI